MGFFDRILSAKKDYPALDMDSSAASRIDMIREQLESLSKQVHKPLEVIPGEEGSYVFIGKPPKDFGIAWIEGEKVLNFKTLVDERGVKPDELLNLSNKLRKVYEENLDDARFTTKIGKKSIVVTPSEQFRNQVKDIIQKASI